MKLLDGIYNTIIYGDNSKIPINCKVLVLNESVHKILSVNSHSEKYRDVSDLSEYQINNIIINKYDFEKEIFSKDTLNNLSATSLMDILLSYSCTKSYVDEIECYPSLKDNIINKILCHQKEEYGL